MRVQSAEKRKAPAPLQREIIKSTITVTARTRQTQHHHKTKALVAAGRVFMYGESSRLISSTSAILLYEACCSK